MVHATIRATASHRANCFIRVFSSALSSFTNILWCPSQAAFGLSHWCTVGNRAIQTDGENSCIEPSRSDRETARASRPAHGDRLGVSGRGSVPARRRGRHVSARELWNSSCDCGSVSGVVFDTTTVVTNRDSHRLVGWIRRGHLGDVDGEVHRLACVVHLFCPLFWTTQTDVHSTNAARGRWRRLQAPTTVAPRTATRAGVGRDSFWRPSGDARTNSTETVLRDDCYLLMRFRYRGRH